LELVKASPFSHHLGSTPAATQHCLALQQHQPVGLTVCLLVFEMISSRCSLSF